MVPGHRPGVIIRVYTHTTAGKADCKVSFTVFSEEENRFARKHVAYVIGDSRGEIHRHRCYRVRFNENPNYPIFEIVEVLENCPG